MRGLCPRCLLQAGLGSQTDPNATVANAGGAGHRRTLPDVGGRFGPYHILRLLGRGGMGVVYEAEEQDTGRRVALKVLGRQFDSPRPRPVSCEGRLAASINHPNSVYVFGTEEIDGTPTIAMELVSGGTLQERVKNQGPMTVAVAVDAILQIIAGLEAAQAIGVCTATSSRGTVSRMLTARSRSVTSAFQFPLRRRRKPTSPGRRDGALRRSARRSNSAARN